MADVSTTTCQPTFSREQLVEYFSRLYQCKPGDGEKKLKDVELLVISDPREALFTLQRRHLVTFPFSNLVLHYSQHHSISLDPDVLYHKIVERGLGGYCVENTGLFSIVLRTLGFKFYPGGARVSKSLSPGPANAEFHGLYTKRRTKVDVGFGPQGPTQPLLLKEEQPVLPGVVQMSLIRKNLSINTDPDQQPWLYRFRKDSDSEWVMAYCFYEIEFTPEDYEIMNYWTSVHPASGFTQGIIFTKFTLNEAEDGIDGALMLLKNIVKRNQKGNVEILKTLESEEERVAALKDFFNVHLLPMEIRGIRGRSTEIKQVSDD
ncbi:N-acetyltransferase family protein, putative [Trichophyton benhamiae CBS 112371]|uniref:N-acetyltransferase family protein, putative n=1 Tax=Arthroderma benhamiae (strain ATCC MYA-4681 / CBS 112371) TaxID=663331 RepID=D4B1H7_ARTBC|nr:N-acetyltransferase family protein, putative [Trichophyton benhamiae CBS 112371]EFE30816.1 N-acetyltransferase family protein, putative [Trichophyton benhamiae CBS 112371]